MQDTLRHLKSWMAPEPTKAPAWLLPARCEVRRDPYGVVLVIAPFNYPFQARASFFFLMFFFSGWVDAPARFAYTRFNTPPPPQRQLAAVPVLNALAAGNCVVLKPSELTPKTSGAWCRWETYKWVGMRGGLDLLDRSGPFDEAKPPTTKHTHIKHKQPPHQKNETHNTQRCSPASSPRTWTRARCASWRGPSPKRRVR